MKAAAAVALTATVLAVPAASLAAARVSSNSNCPSSEAISLKLLGLLSAGGPETASARVRMDAESMYIEVSTPSEASRQRTVPIEGDCEARAEMAAFIIAAWLDAMPVGTISAPGVPPKAVKSVPTTGGEPDPLDEPEVEPLSISTRTFLGGGVFGLADGLGGSAGVAASVCMPSLIENAGWLLEASLGLSRQMTVGQGTAHILRPTFALSATVALHRQHWVVRAQLGPALGILRVNGTGYEPNRSDTSVMWGVDAGLSLVRPWKRHELWLRIEAIAWPQGRGIVTKQLTSGTDALVPLPDWEVRPAIGFSWGGL
jgi:hypothetical protein